MVPSWMILMVPETETLQFPKGAVIFRLPMLQTNQALR